MCTILAFGVLGCSKKPDQSATNSDTTANSDQTGTGSQPAANTPPEASTASSSPAEARKPKPEAPKPEAPKPIVVPAGTALTIRVGSTLSSKTSQTGQTFTGTIASPVAVDGETVIPEGSSVMGTVVEAKSAGRFKGASSLSLRLTSVTVNGTPYEVETSGVSQGQKGKGKRSAAMIGGGAGVGALIGGLAGGGKGAAIGALVGGGAGTAGAGLTGNRDVTMPAESALTFTLSASVQISRKAR